jgi:tRNA pseudouridine55 synthase
VTPISATTMSGILAVDKPAGLTSHDVVARVRHMLGVKRVGHAGTLDPMATGLLVVLVGSATRLARFVEAGTKTYDARIVFGTSTDTDDAEGAITATADVPASLADPAVAHETVAALVGPVEQVPPAYAAIKIDGRKAYDLARRGEAPEMAPRPVTIHAARLLGLVAGPPVTWDLSLDVSRGTYVRAIARDLGVAHGTVAHLGALRRTAVGALTLADAVGLDQLLDEGAGALGARLADPLAAIGLPVLELTGEQAEAVSHGSALPFDCATGLGDLADDAQVALTASGRLLGVYRRKGDLLKADVVLAEALDVGPAIAGGTSPALMPAKASA